MKKCSISRNDKKNQTVKQFNIRLRQGDNDINKSVAMSGPECMVEHQAEYIDNLQQQIYALESEVAYLNSHLQERNKQHPSMLAEGERLVKKLADSQNEMKNTKIEMKRKQTTIDLLKSEKDRTQRSLEESEERFRKEKCKLLEELITLQKERDSLQDTNTKTETAADELKQEHVSLQEDFDHLEVEMQQLKYEKSQDKETMQKFLESKEMLQKELIEAKMTIEAKSTIESNEAINELKDKIAQLHVEIETLKQTCEHESSLRERLAHENAELIKRHAGVEADLAEAKACLREEQSRLASLEQLHLNTILESSETKSREQTYKEDMEKLNGVLKEERERSYNLAQQVTDEQRLKSREEENTRNLQQRFDQREDKMKVLKTESITIQRDNTFLKDQVLHMKQELQVKDQEVLGLKQKVQEMQMSVEEFIQSNQAAARLAGERWKQLGNLAKSIQVLTSVENMEHL